MPDIKGNLTSFDKQKVAEWMLKHGIEKRPCPYCGVADWRLAEHLVQPLTAGGNSVQIGGPSYPQIMLISTVCGHTAFFNAVLIGILPLGGVVK